MEREDLRKKVEKIFVTKAVEVAEMWK
jgi:hypothetical protein